MAYRVALGFTESETPWCEMSITGGPVDWCDVVWRCADEDAKVIARNVLWASRFNVACMEHIGNPYRLVSICPNYAQAAK